MPVTAPTVYADHLIADTFATVSPSDPYALPVAPVIAPLGCPDADCVRLDLVAEDDSMRVEVCSCSGRTRAYTARATGWGPVHAVIVRFLGEQLGLSAPSYGHPTILTEVTR